MHIHEITKKANPDRNEDLFAVRIAQIAYYLLTRESQADSSDKSKQEPGGICDKDIKPK